MEIIPEETAAAEPREGPAEPGPAPPALGNLQPSEPPGTPQERTLPSATGQPGPEGQLSSMEAEPPPSPYLTPDFGKEDPFEILGKAGRCLPCSHALGPSVGWHPWAPPAAIPCCRLTL